MEKIVFFLIFIILSSSQFTSFVPGYDVQEIARSQRNRGSSSPGTKPTIKIPTKQNPQPAAQPIQKLQPKTQQFIKSHLPPNIPPNFPFFFLPCFPVNGICNCPPGFTEVGGYCILSCQPPMIIINGVCVCPNGHIMSPFGFCIPDSNTNNPQNCINDPNSICALANINRSFDGTKNNIFNPSYGSKGSILQRRALPAAYIGSSKPVTNRPNPRFISNTVGAVVGPIQKSVRGLTMAFVIWGQFLDHDIDLTPHGNSQSFNIDIPNPDPFFGNQDFIGFSRSQFVPGNPRQHKNVISAWIDGSQIYGCNEADAIKLRQFNQGKMKLPGNLLPKDVNNLFVAGDIRVNENVFLTTYHTIFVREHNRLCDEIFSDHPNLVDEQIYQIARHYVIGLLQKITMDEFLPFLLGIEYFTTLGPYTIYNPSINPNIPTEFSTAAYRVGHSLLVDKYPFLSQSGSQVNEFDLTDLFFKPNLISDSFMEQALRGLAKNKMKEKSAKVADSVRNLLVLDPNNSQIKLDLYSMNIQRGRDHGLPTYNKVRQAYGLSTLTSFSQLVSDPQIAQNLQTAYGNINKLDLVVGIFAEDSVTGGVLGKLGARIVAQTFRNLRNGDRFWYQNQGQAYYPSSIRNQIKTTTLKDIIVRNTGIQAGQLPNNVFKI